MPQSRIPISQAMADDTIAKYLNDYRCPDCLLDLAMTGIDWD